MMTREIIEGLDPNKAREFLDELSEHNGAFLEALVVEVAYGISTDVDPLMYLNRLAAQAKPLTDEEDSQNDDSILDEEHILP